jgi:hypothetical protein
VIESRIEMTGILACNTHVTDKPSHNSIALPTRSN